MSSYFLFNAAQPGVGRVHVLGSKKTFRRFRRWNGLETRKGSQVNQPRQHSDRGSSDWGYPDWGYQELGYPDQGYPDQGVPRLGGLQTSVLRLRLEAKGWGKPGGLGSA